ncbi:hypothetical protein MMC30_004933 [Trapelia coarctata]|nr:hypothetical protein [Trapelia coarctata]
MVNRQMLERAIGALNHLAPELKFVVFPSVTKVSFVQHSSHVTWTSRRSDEFQGYGIQVPGGVFTAPVEESTRSLPEPYGSKINCYALREVLEEQSKGKNWTWCDVGFVPNGSAFNLTAHWANYLCMYALVEGKGAKVPFPRTESAYASLFNEASADIIARFSSWAALHPAQTGGGSLLNVADRATPSQMTERWPALAHYFGLEGIGPVHDPTLLKPGEYTRQYRKALEEQGVKANEVFKLEFLDTYGYCPTFDRHLSLGKARSAGFSEEIDPNPSWFEAFDRFKQAGLIPN